MGKVLVYAFDWQDFFNNGSSGNDPAPLGYLAFITVSRIDLTDPAGISITSSTDKELVVEVAELEGFRGPGIVKHGFSLN